MLKTRGTKKAGVSTGGQSLKKKIKATSAEDLFKVLPGWELIYDAEEAEVGMPVECSSDRGRLFVGGGEIILRRRLFAVWDKIKKARRERDFPYIYVGAEGAGLALARTLATTPELIPPHWWDEGATGGILFPGVELKISNPATRQYKEYLILLKRQSNGQVVLEPLLLDVYEDKEVDSV